MNIDPYIEEDIIINFPAPKKYAVEVEVTAITRRKMRLVAMSPKVAAKLRSKEISAFVPVSATDLVWQEALKGEPDEMP